jgi:hypothetical protein
MRHGLPTRRQEALARGRSGKRYVVVFGRCSVFSGAPVRRGMVSGLGHCEPVGRRGVECEVRPACAAGPGRRAIDDDESSNSRIFTLAEAQELLPELEALFERFNSAREAASAVAVRLDEIERSRSKENLMEVARPLREAREDLGEYAERMRLVIREVLAMGVEIKRLDPALLDFPAVRDDRLVYLCWQEGEATIAFWHEVDAGFAGRRPLA